jgi:hypothetical protein
MTPEPESEISMRLRDHPIVTAVFIVGVAATGGFIVAGLSDGKLREVMLTAATSLIFVALLGGLVKLLLDDVQRQRESRYERARFITAILADLKSVYDRVERVRILIGAHHSALTYGNEMRDLIDSTVQLSNVKRALDAGTSGIQSGLCEIRNGVDLMKNYLEGLIEEFVAEYKVIADKQRIYEAAVNARLDAAKQSEDGVADFADVVLPENQAWAAMLVLPRLKEFRESQPQAEPAPIPSSWRQADLEYEDFVRSLDRISYLLRTDLQSLQTRW